MVKLLELTDRPKTVGFQADMAHTLLYTLGFNAPEDAILPPDWDWSDPKRLDTAMKTLTAALRPWTIDFHVAQNDATVHGSGTHDKTGHHCLAKDPNGKLTIPHHAGYWLHGEDGKLTKAIRHICWDGCMFPNAVMQQRQTWNDILAAMISVRDAHGWAEEEDEIEEEEEAPRMAAPVIADLEGAAGKKAPGAKRPTRAKGKKTAKKPAATRKRQLRAPAAAKKRSKSAKPIRKTAKTKSMRKKTVPRAK